VHSIAKIAPVLLVLSQPILAQHLDFGFGFGARICPGQHLGQLEAALAVGALVKLFTFTAPAPDYHANAGVSTKPSDGTLVELTLRPAETRQT